MRRLPLAALLLALLTPLSARAQDEPAAELFPMGVWYEGGVGGARDNVLPEDPAKAAEIYEKNFADIAAHGINVFTIPNSPPNHHKLVLDTAQKHGLKVILELGLDGGPFGAMIRGSQPMDDKAVKDTLDTVLTPVKDHPALLRVQLLDEPPNDAFARYGKIAEQARQFNPRTPPFCCLVGNADGEKFLKETKSDVVAFDMYPITPQIKEGDDKPLREFASTAARFADWAGKNNAQSWAVIQCHAITGGLRFPTPDELRCMTYAALATGNKGVFWFLYQSEAVGNGMMDGLVDREFKKRPLWDTVGTLTKEIKPLLPTLEKLKPDPATKLTCTQPGVAYALRDAGNKLYVFVVNFDAAQEQELSANAPAGGGTHVINMLDKSPMRLTPAGAGAGPGWSATLPPGGGALFRID